MQDTIETVGMLLIKGVVIPVIGLFLAWASAHLPAWLKSKTTNERAAGILERLGQLAMAVVQETEQTVVAKLGDKADADSLRAARDSALASLKSHLGDKGLKELETVFGLENQDAVIKMLITFIEQAVHTLGIQQTAMATEAASKTSTSSASTTVVVPPPAA
jgi:vacuolar-type H+-ATPase catalytic subunit A/Vma1